MSGAAPMYLRKVGQRRLEGEGQGGGKDWGRVCTLLSLHRVVVWGVKRWFMENNLGDVLH